MSALQLEKAVGALRSDNVYERLREAIVTGRARPNERLIEVELAHRLQVSRTPIRESLQRLAAEGLVVSRRRGWVVLEHTSVEIREIYEARAALEGYCARLAAERATEGQLKEIASLHHGGPKRILKSSRQHLVEVNDHFHDAIIAAAKNERLAHMIRRNRAYYFNFRIAQLYSDEEAKASIAGHQAIARALLHRDPNRAEREMHAHIELALSVILAKLR
ncbi:MAG TPA: GntR family transcriptional regulator [Terriglobales bacterium]|nr:GntR family transcriptional regulator [Terriglobales bacterium]